jgi:hypothetical protein
VYPNDVYNNERLNPSNAYVVVSRDVEEISAP